MAEGLVGYKLIDGKGIVHNQWGGTWGIVPAIPNPLRLPSGDHVHAPQINVNYDGYTLTEWMMGEPPPSVPVSITRRQAALELYALQYITLQEALDMVKTASVPQAISAIFDALVSDGSWTAEQRTLAEIDFAADNYYRANSLLALMGLTSGQIDQFFISASTR